MKNKNDFAPGDFAPGDFAPGDFAPGDFAANNISANNISANNVSANNVSANNGPRLSRRESLKSLGSGFAYLSMIGLAADQVAANKINQATVDSGQSTTSALQKKSPHFPAKAKRVIFLCMRGGPSHVDTFDYKPELNQRSGQLMNPKSGPGGAQLLGSPFKFDQHGESGLWISRLFPQLAEQADRLCVINSMNTDLPNHPQAFVQMHTGSFQFTRPSLGAWSLYGLGTENENLPGFITLNPPADMGGAKNYGSAFLPAIYQGTKIGGGQIPELYAQFLGTNEEPGPPLKNLTNDKLSKELQRAQLDLIQQHNRKKLARDQYHPEIEGAIESFELAFRMQAEIPDLLSIKSESKSTLEMYGVGKPGTSERFARQCLMARRMVEAGVRHVEITAPVEWDHHRNLKQSLTETCGETDQPIAALLTDLAQRGMLDETLVIWAGEFGRTPYAQSLNGRDHNNKGYSIWMAGGGVKGGMAHGATDELGYKAVEDPVHIHDWHATILHLMGLDHKRLTFNYAGRDFRLTDVYGEVVKKIMA